MPEDHDSSMGEPAQIVPWLRTLAGDLIGLDFERPISTSTTSDFFEISEQYRVAAEFAEPSSARVFAMLSALLGMHFREDEPHEPFGPMVAFSDGNRSAIPSDFRGPQVGYIGDLALKAQNPVLRSRLADLGRVLDRKNGKLGRVAILAYIEIAEKIDSGELRCRFDKGDDAIQYSASILLRRTLQISRAIGWETDEALTARTLVRSLRKRTIDQANPASAFWFARLDLDLGVSNPGEIGTDLENLLGDPSHDIRSTLITDLWRLAAKAFQSAKMPEEKYRCQRQAAECLVADSERHQSSAMISAHRLSAAIAELRGIPSMKDRRTQLRHRLIDIQSNISDEMTRFSHDLDLSDLNSQMETELKRHINLLDRLFVFADLNSSPNPERLVEDATEVIKKYPLSSIFGTSHHDNEGKVIHRSAGARLEEPRTTQPFRRR